VHDAGPFGGWLDDLGAALRGERDADVPCGGCTACCESSQFVHVEPDETDALAHIPATLLFPAPRQPKGHLLLGYDEHGRCPMLVEQRCSIYAHRPRACRTYDCRVFAAAGVDPVDKPAVAVRVRGWRFTYPTPGDHAAQQAVRDGVPDDGSPTERAVLAVRRGIEARSAGLHTA
jgi:hypothetical protein